MKSGPTSGPLTVSSQVTQAPHGICPPEQFIIVPFRLVKARRTLPCLRDWIVVVPPPAIGSYGVPGPNAGPRVVDLVVAHQHHGVVGPVERAHAVVPPGQCGAVVQHDRLSRCRGTSGS